MNTLGLIRLIRHNESIKESRHPAFERSRFMKIFVVLILAYYAACMILMGVMLPLAFRDMWPGIASFHILSGGSLFLVIADFWCRFLMQETPAQMGANYALLPIRRSLLMHLFLVESGLSTGNLFWGFFLVPFGGIAVLPLLGWTGYACWLIGYWLIFVANSYAYSFCRALCLKHLAWTLMPLALHLVLILLYFLPSDHFIDRFSTLFIYNIAQCRIWPYILLCGIISLLYIANYHLQHGMVRNDIAKKEDVKVTRSGQMNFLNHFGVTGEYMKLEFKMVLRNSRVRNQFYIVLGAMVTISALLYFTDIYDGMPFMKSFICLYDYIVPGMTTLIGIMGYEGNYIDGLMSRRESILSLLKSKYYFNTLLLLVPIIILIPLLVSGKISLMMNLGYLFFTSGVLYPIVFQLAVYNKDTLPLNKKITAKNNSFIQSIISMSLLFVPIGVEKLATLLLGDPWGYVLLMTLGIVGIATHKWWLRHIYDRFMARRYNNMEGFRATRNQ